MFSQIYTIIRPLVFILIVLLIGCAGFKKVQRELTTPEKFKNLPDELLDLKANSSPFLKVHMKNGNVYVLQNWSMDNMREHIVGKGFLLNANRDTLSSGEFQVGVDSVAIFETNVIKTSETVTALTVFTGITVAITAYCIANPKACFGSCPTFYVADGDSLHPDAEGFSSSIAPSLEASDIDALFHTSSMGGEFSVEMRNEALETHVVRKVELLAVPRSDEHRVFVDSKGNFWEAESILSPDVATGPEGDILELVLNADRIERYSRADSNYLGAKEYIELEFDGISNGDYGLVIGSRQTLLSTYLLYQTFAYMGGQVGHWFAQLERNNLKLRANSIFNILGGIEVLMQTPSGRWKSVGSVNEYGPLAIDFHLIPLGVLKDETIKIRLRMTKGHWRIDYVALARLNGRVYPLRLEPYEVLKEGIVDNESLVMLNDSSRQLVTLPGDRYLIKFRIPDTDNQYELFLRSKGYYLEWIRQEWIEEENPVRLAEMLLKPKAFLKHLAPEFKEVEEEMEKCFWNSRYEKHN